MHLEAGWLWRENQDKNNTVFEIDVDVDPVYPMKGANGFAYGWFSASGGVGNPSGAYSSSGSYVQYEGLNGAAQPQNVGVGGRIIIFCNNFVNNGTIQANGVSAYSSPMYFSASGGASGGGAIDIFYGNSCRQALSLQWWDWRRPSRLFNCNPHGEGKVVMAETVQLPFLS